MLIECQNCGAPLDAKDNARSAKCGYCGRKNQLQQAKTIAPRTPPNWQPPPRWQPPPHVPMRSAQQLVYKPPRGMGLLVLLPILLGVGIPAIGAFMATGGGNWLKVATWDGKSTLECGVNGHLVLKDVKAKVKSGAVLDAGTNCRLELVNSTIEGPIGIQGSINTKIQLDNSTIIAEETGIEGSANLEVRATNSKIESEDVGIKGGSNPNVDLRDTSIAGGDVGVEGGANMVLAMRGKSRIEGGAVAVRGGSNPKMELRGGTIESKKGVAIEASHNAKLDCKDSTITGATAFDVKLNGKLRIGSCKVSGERKLGLNSEVN